MNLECYAAATYNTARAEVAVAWLSSVILPEKEVSVP